MSKKCIILKGLPASGKSTWAKELVAQYPGHYKIINKDSLRAMLDGGKWSKGNEQFILKARDMLILLALEEGYHVIVDDTNLHSKHEQTIKELVKGKALVEIQDFTDVPLETCLERDRNRPNYVGEKTIKDMYRQFLQPKPVPPAYDPALPDVVICDIDGTLALMNGRNPYDASTCEEDSVNEVVRSILSSCRAYIILVSGRGEQYRPETERWLMKHTIVYSQLYMRPEGDNRKDATVKQEIYERQIKGQGNVRFILDDRNQMVEMWRSLGLTCLQVADGDY